MLAANLIINKLLQTKDFSIVKKHGLESYLFDGYEDEFNFITDHYKKYGNVPDEMPFAEKFPDFEPFVVNETDEYLIDKLQEEYGYKKFTQMLPTLNEKLKDDSRVAYEYLRKEMANLRPKTINNGKDIIDISNERLEEHNNISKLKSAAVISSGFPELDMVINGFKKGNDLVVVVARTNVGKTWFVMKMLHSAWEQGYRVGMYSGEMDIYNLGFRFDTLNGNFSNFALTRGLPLDNYEEYIKNLKNNDNRCFKIITRSQLGKRATVNDIRNFVEENNLDIVAIDQLYHMEDISSNKNELIRAKLGHISEDLMELSIECKIPVILIVQANRDGIKKDNNQLGLENIRESDEIAHNCSTCIGLRKDENNNYYFDILKNRSGKSGGFLCYYCDINKGIFTYNPLKEDCCDSAQKFELCQNLQDSMDIKTSENPF